MEAGWSCMIPTWTITLMLYTVIPVGVVMMVIRMIQEQKRKRAEAHPEFAEVARDAEERLVKTSRDLIRRRYNAIRPPKRLKLSGDKLIPGRKIGFLFHVEPRREEYRIFWKRHRFLPGKYNTALVFPEEITDLNGSEVVLEGCGFKGIGLYDRYLISASGMDNVEEIGERHTYNGFLKYLEQLVWDLRGDMDWGPKSAVRGDKGLALLELEKQGEIPTVETRRIREEQRRRVTPQQPVSEIDQGGA